MTIRRCKNGLKPCEDLHPDLKPYVTVDTVREFARTVYDVLCRLYDGADAKADIERLMKTDPHSVQEANGFIEIDESFEAFLGVRLRGRVLVPR
jgi:hypothetical protein